MSIEINASGATCSRCGKTYSRRKGFFSVNYGAIYKGIGYLTVCKECVDKLYNGYLSQCNDAKSAVRQVCRKLDLFWSEKVYADVERKNTTHTMMTAYLSKIYTSTYAGKSYDDTLAIEGTLWSWSPTSIVEAENAPIEKGAPAASNISEETIAFWGAGYSDEVYSALAQKYEYLLSKLPPNTEIDIGTELLLKQICSLEIDIARDRAAGRPVDKNVNALNNLLGSANLKPTQKKSDDGDSSIDTTPLGVWVKRWENKRPIPEPDPELQDVDGIIRYISIWFFGHLCKMLGIKNAYCKLYETEIARLRAERPDLDEEDDETVFNETFNIDDEDYEED